MKVLIPILIGLLVLGCGKGNQTANTNDGNNTPAKSPKKEAGESTPSKGDDKNSTKTKSSKEITKEDVVGSYIRKSGSKTRKLGLLENGKVESYLDDDKVREGSWMIAGNEVHINLIGLSVWRIESNGDLTAVASIKDEKREEAPIDRQTTFKKTK